MPRNTLPPSLRLAVATGARHSIEAWIRSGHDVNAVDSRGRTLLLMAAAKGNAELCRLLLDAGADPFVTDHEGRDAVSAASRNGNAAIDAMLRSRVAPPPTPGPRDPDAPVSTPVAVSDRADATSGLSDSTDAPPRLARNVPGAPASTLVVVPSPADETADAFFEDDFDPADWEESEDLPAPPDDPELRLQAGRLETRIAGHDPIDTDSDWVDVEIDLPVESEPVRAAWIEDARDLIRFGLSCGWVTTDQLLEVCRRGEGSRDADEIETRVRVVLGDLGIPVQDERDAHESVAARGPEGYALQDAHDMTVEDAVACLVDLCRVADPIEYYSRDVHRVKRSLSAAEEYELAARMAAGRDLGASDVTGMASNLLGFDKTIRAAARARVEFAEANLRLVLWVAIRSWGLPFLDRVQEGNLGLLKAVDRFDRHRGVKFSTMAVWWIRQSLWRGVADQHRMIRLPVHIHDTRRRVRKVVSEAVSRSDRVPDAPEIASKLDLSLVRIRNVLAVPDDADPIGLVTDFPEDCRTIDPDDSIGVFMLRHAIDIALTILTPREQQVIRLRFGVGGDGPLTLAEIGAELSVTRERIRQIQAGALRKLRNHAGSSGLDAFAAPPDSPAAPTTDSQKPDDTQHEGA